MKHISKTITITEFPIELKKELIRQAKEQGLTLTAYIRMLLIDQAKGEIGG